MENPDETIPYSPSDRRAFLVERILILSALVFALTGIGTLSVGDSANSRLATVYSLVHHGTWYIDRSPELPQNPYEAKTIDKCSLDGRLLSTKPPLLPLAMTSEYAALRWLYGWSLEPDKDLKIILQVMIVSLIILPYFVGVVFFALLLDLLIANPWHRLLPLFVVAFGTQLPGFAANLNNHTPAIAALTIALYFAIGICAGKLAPTRWHFFGFGVSGGLVFTLDMPLTIFVAVSGIALAIKHPKQAVPWAGLGMFIPLALHFGTMLYVTGSPLPVQMRKELYLFEDSAWRNPGGLDALNEPKGTYFFHMTFGRFGIFLLYPILLFGPAGLIWSMFRGDGRWRNYYVAAVFCMALLFAYYVFRTNNYGGGAYGFRWGMGIMPVLVLMGIPLFERVRGIPAWIVVSLLLVVSCYSAWECYMAPWGACHEWTCRWIFGAPYLLPTQAG
jgi:hypothetical protein